MTSTSVQPPTLQDVKDRFVAASDLLERVTQELDELQTAVGALADAAASVREAAKELGRIGQRYAQLLELNKEQLGLIREAIETLAKSDPGRVITSVEQLKTQMTEVRTVLAADLRAASDTHLTANQKLGARLSMVTSILAALIVAGTLVVLLLR